MKTINFQTNSYEETEKFGQSLGKLLRPNDVVLMSGDLGAGKTAMTRGILSAFTEKDIVSSPTFALMNMYDVEFENKKISVVHCDAYRLTSIDDLDEVGFFDFSDGNIAIIEWADVVYEMPVLKKGYYNIIINRCDDISISMRKITVICDDKEGEILESSIH